MTLKEKVAELFRELRPMCIAKNRNLASEINSTLMKHLDERAMFSGVWPPNCTQFFAPRGHYP